MKYKSWFFQVFSCAKSWHFGLVRDYKSIWILSFSVPRKLFYRFFFLLDIKRELICIKNFLYNTKEFFLCEFYFLIFILCSYLIEKFMNCTEQIFYYKSISNSFSQAYANFNSLSELVLSYIYKTDIIRRCNLKFWNEFNIVSSIYRMCQIHKFIHWICSVMIFRTKIVSRIKVWNQNWMLVLKIWKLLHILI